MLNLTARYTCMCVCVLSHPVMSDSVTPWTVAHQAPLSMGFSRQEYWNDLPFPTPGDLSDPGIESSSLALSGDVLCPLGSTRYVGIRECPVQ